MALSVSSSTSDAGGKPGRGERVGHLGGERRIGQLPRREVHRHVHAGVVAHPGRRVAAGEVQGAAPERNDESGLFGERHEDRRRDTALHRVIPADQRLDAHDALRREFHDRLVVEQELAAVGIVECAAQVGLQAQPPHHRLEHARLEQLVAAAAVRLGEVHRHVGVTQHVAGRVDRLGDGDAEARRARRFAAEHAERHLERRGDAVRDVEHRLPVAGRLEQHGELVAAQPGHHVVRTRPVPGAASRRRSAARRPARDRRCR